MYTYMQKEVRRAPFGPAAPPACHALRFSVPGPEAAYMQKYTH